MDYYSDQLLSTLGFWMFFFIIHGGVLLLSLIILINKLWKRQTVIGAEEESTTAPPVDLVSSADHTSSSSTNGWSYEVFLSFRGLDTRNTFTDHLYTALVAAGIHTFRDDNEIRMGQDLSSELLTAIQQSRISIPIFSRNYASSKWCLIELTKMVECRENKRQIVLPIFYDVEPSDVRHQRGTYAKAFSQHQKRVDKKIMEEWREALNVIGSLKGENVKNRPESELVKSVVQMVLSELKKNSLVSTSYLVGIPHRVKEMLKLLDTSSLEVRIVGIHGMGGIGKTTIARAVYNEISCHFENRCFLEDVRETYQQHKGLVQLQKQLISNILRLKDVDITSVDEGVNMIKERCRNKKVLIVLDDVGNSHQLRALANKHDWFGLGSRIIITTRDKHIVNKDVVDEVYIPGELSRDQSLALFSMHAFRRDQPLDEYYDLSSAIAQTAGGLPLALEVLGSHLSGKAKAVWDDTLKKSKKIPHHEVQKKLRISYDELDHEQKQIFLDIACFFIGMNKRIATYICEEYFPNDGIDILLLRSLIKIGDNNELTMHSQLRDLGREIVRSENFNEPGERSRLWIHDDAWEVLKTHSGTRKVQGLRLDFQSELRNEEFAQMSELGNGSEENCLRNEEFAEMSRLRLLQMDYVIIAGDFKHLLSRLRWLSWKGCPYNFTATNFHPEKLIVLDLSQSKVTEDWDGWNQIKMAKKLKFINLSGCSDLIKTPDFSAFPSLEELILEDCKSLVEIHASIGYLKCLVFLNVKDCQSLVDLPISICGLNSLESLIVSGCIKLSRLPTGLESLKALRVLRIDGTSMEQLPDSIELPKNLEILSVRNCRYFNVLPTSIGHLRFLTSVALDGTQIVILPDSIGSLSKLRHLSLNRCRSLRKIPDSVGQLESLVELDLYQAGVTKIPDSIGQLRFLTNLVLDETPIVMLPDSIGSLLKLRHLSLSRCRSLRKIPNSIGQLESLVNLNLYHTGVTKIPDSIGQLKSLITFSLDRTQLIELPDSVGLLVKLEKLSLSYCTSLRKIPDSIWQLESLVELSMLQDLSLRGCWSLRRIPDSIGRLESLCVLYLTGSGIIEIPDAIGELKSLVDLELDDTQIIELPDSIGLLSMLQRLSLRKCGSLRRIPNSIGRLKSLRSLDLSGTGIIEIPDAIGELKYLVDLQLDGTQIIELPDSIGSLSMLPRLSLNECGSLRRIPDSIGRMKSLRRIYLNGSGIIEISDAIGELKSLKDLQLDSTRVIELPDSIGSLSMLYKLSSQNCFSLRRVPDTIGHLKSLTQLLLDGTQITKLPDSISSLSKLKSLSLMRCRLLRKIPDSIGRLESLRNLFLKRTGLIEIPDAIGELKFLTDLQLDGTQITELPDSIGLLSMMQRLSLKECKSLIRIPNSIGRLESLRGLYLTSTAIIEIPHTIGELKSLRDLILDGTQIIELPNSIGSLSMLVGLSLKKCDSLRRIPDTIGRLKSLTQLLLDGTQITELPESIWSLSKLQRLSLMHCRLLRKIPEFIGRLESLHWLELDTAGIMDIPNAMRNHGNVKDLCIDMSGIDGWEIPIDIGKLPHSLTSLTLGIENSFILPESISSLRLEILDIRNCRNHPSLPHLPSTLSSLNISRCAMETLPNFSNLTNLRHLTIADCENLLEIPSLKLGTLSISNCKKLQCFPNLPVGLRELSLSSSMSVESIPELSSCTLVQSLQLIDFFKQTEIQGLERMKSLTSLDLSGCRSIERLRLSTMKSLYTLILRNCEKLCDIEGLERLEILYQLDVSGCISLERLPNLSNLKKLEGLWISNCKQLIRIQGINKAVRMYGRTTRSRYVKVKSAAGVEHLKNEKFTEDRGIKRSNPSETHRSIKRLRSLETLINERSTEQEKLNPLCRR